MPLNFLGNVFYFPVYCHLTTKKVCYLSCTMFIIVRAWPPPSIARRLFPIGQRFLGGVHLYYSYVDFSRWECRFKTIAQINSNVQKWYPSGRDSAAHVGGYLLFLRWLPLSAEQSESTYAHINDAHSVNVINI